MHENEGGGLTQMLIKSHRVMILTDHGFHLKGEQYRQFLEAIYGPYIQQIFFLLEKYLFRNMKIHKNQGVGLTQMLIKSYRDMILTNQGFLLKEEQYRQFLETIYGQYLQQNFFLLKKDCFGKKLQNATHLFFEGYLRCRTRAREQIFFVEIGRAR